MPKGMRVSATIHDYNGRANLVYIAKSRGAQQDRKSTASHNSETGSETNLAMQARLNLDIQNGKTDR